MTDINKSKWRLSLHLDIFGHSLHDFEKRRLFLQFYNWRKISEEDKPSGELNFFNFSQSEISKASFRKLIKGISVINVHFEENLVNKLSDIDLIRIIQYVKEYDNLRLIEIINIVQQIDDSETGRMSIPEEKSELFIESIKKDKLKRIYYQADYGLASIFKIASECNCEIYVEGNVVSDKLIETLKSLTKLKIYTGNEDPLINPAFVTPGYELEKFDCAILLPRIGVKDQQQIMVICATDRYNRFNGLSGANSYYDLAIEHAVKCTTGKIIVILPEVFFNSTVASEVSFRQYLIERNLVDKVIFLPENLYKNTTITTPLLILDNKKKNKDICFVDASKSYRKKLQERKNQLINIQSIVSACDFDNDLIRIRVVTDYEELKKFSWSLAVTPYILTDEDQQAETFLQKFNTITLGNFATISRPPVIKETDTSELSVKEVFTRDIPDYGFIDSTSSDKSINDIKQVSKYLLKPYDVLLTVKGSVGKVGVISPDLDDNWIPNQVFVVIRFNEKQYENAVFIYRYFKSNVGKAYLKKLTFGTTVPMIPAKALEDIPIPVPTATQLMLEMQAFEKEIQLYKEIQTIKSEIDRQNNFFMGEVI